MALISRSRDEFLISYYYEGDSPNPLADVTLLTQENAYVETRGGDSKRSHTDMDFLSRIVYHNCESD